MGNSLAKLVDSHMWLLLRRILGTYLRPYLRRVGVALIFMVVSAAMTAMFAKLLQPVLDNVLVARRGDLILPMAMTVLATFIISGLSTYVHTLVMNTVGQSIVSDIQRDLFRSIIGLDLKFFHENPSGQIISRLVNDVAVMRITVSDAITGIGKNFLTLLFLGGLMFWQDWRLALIAICLVPPTVLFVAKLGKRLRKVARNTQSEIGGLTDRLSQIFLGIRQVKAYGMEGHENDRAASSINRVRDLYFKGFRISNLATPVNEALIGLVMTGLIIYGGHQVVGGHMTAGELMSFIAAYAMSYEPIKRMAKLNGNIQMGLGAAERVFDMMDRQAQIVDRPGAVELSSRRPEITFENVSFHYTNDGGHALDGVSLRIPAGKVTALVGASGSGKTTAMNLVPRLYDVTGGKLTIAGHDVRDISLKSLREHIALVSQDITIFDESARDNIAYGRPGATEDEIIAAAKAAAADDFIRALPQGYDTRLGENGVNLSGGQRQRIAIARAILRDAPILLLDEATSALDNESERAIQASLENLQKGRTTLVIAHRLSTVQNADQIIVLDKGHVAESGTHDELLGRNGIYARMHNLGGIAA